MSSHARHDSDVTESVTRTHSESPGRPTARRRLGVGLGLQTRVTGTLYRDVTDAGGGPSRPRPGPAGAGPPAGTVSESAAHCPGHLAAPGPSRSQVPSRPRQVSSLPDSDLAASLPGPGAAGHGPGFNLKFQVPTAVTAQ